MLSTNQTILHTIIGGNDEHLRGGSAHLLELREAKQTKARLLVDVGCAWATDKGVTKFSMPDLVEVAASADAIILTHPHNDHISGLPRLVALMRAKGLFIPPITKITEPPLAEARPAGSKRTNSPAH